MANTNSPFGFSPSRKVPGSGMDFGMTTRLIKGTTNTACFKGDPVIWDSVNPGYVTATSSPSTGTIVGIAWGFQWLNSSQGANPWNLYYPGSSVVGSGNVSVLVIDDPNTIFRVQCGATGLTQADVGANIQYVSGTGNVNNGISGAYLSSPNNTTNTLPFQVYNIPTGPTASVAGAYDIIEVTFANQIFKNTTGA